MKICVYGAGAIGGHLAMRLHRGGADVSLIARGPHLAAIRANGLTVHAVDGTHQARLPATDTPAELGPQDAVFVTVKAPALAQVAAGISPLLASETSVTFMMNGIPWWYCYGLGTKFDGRSLPRIDPGDVLRDTIGTERTLGGVVYSASAVTAPGVIEVEQPKSRYFIGELHGSLTPRIFQLTELLRTGGVDGRPTPSIRTEIWTKLMSNLAGGTLAVLTGAPPKAVYAEPAAESAARAAMHEAAAIATALGCNMSRVDPEEKIAGGRSMDHKPSILQDLELGRPMEVDGMFDAPLALARMAGVETPALDLLVALCKIRAQGAGLYSA
jgi:2-dehydropantoate 2-reductase